MRRSWPLLAALSLLACSSEAGTQADEGDRGRTRPLGRQIRAAETATLSGRPAKAAYGSLAGTTREAGLDAWKTRADAPDAAAWSPLRAGQHDVDGPIRVTGAVSDADGVVVAKSIVEFPLIPATDGTGEFTTGIAVYQQPEGRCANLKLFGRGSSYGNVQAPGGGMLDIYQSKRKSRYQATVGPPLDGEEADGTYEGIPFTLEVAPVRGTDRARATMSGDGNGASDLQIELPTRFTADVEVVTGVVFQAPGGMRFRLSVSDDGQAVWTPVL